METTSNIPSAPATGSLIARYASQIAGQLGCFDRVIITGSLMDVCHPAALERQLHSANIRCFDLGQFAEPLRDALRDHAVTLARAWVPAKMLSGWCDIVCRRERANECIGTQSFNSDPQAAPFKLSSESLITKRARRRATSLARPASRTEFNTSLKSL